MASFASSATTFGARKHAWTNYVENTSTANANLTNLVCIFTVLFQIFLHTMQQIKIVFLLLVSSFVMTFKLNFPVTVSNLC